MQKLTNLRYRFNDGDFFKNMAYPEVDFLEAATSKPAFLSNKEYTNKTDFDKQFKSIIQSQSYWYFHNILIFLT